FVFLNQVPVQLNLPFLAPQQAFLHEVAGYSAIAGALFSGLLALGPLWTAKRSARALRRQVRSLEEQMKALQESSGPPALYSDISTVLAPYRAATVARADEEPV